MSQPPSNDMKSLAQHQFDAWAGSYDHSLLNRFLFRPAHVAFMEEIARWQAAHRRPFRLLDVGCGTGTLAGWLTASPWPVDVVGMDYAPGMCREASAKADGQAPKKGDAALFADAAFGDDDRSGEAAGAPRRKRTASPSFVCADSEHLPYADAAFDIITCSNSFHHYPHQQAVVKEMRRVLRPRGRLILIDGFRDNIVGWVTFDVIIARMEGAGYHAPWSVVHRYFEVAGFTAIRHRKLNFWFPLLVTTADAE